MFWLRKSRRLCDILVVKRTVYQQTKTLVPYYRIQSPFCVHSLFYSTQLEQIESRFSTNRTELSLSSPISHSLISLCYTDTH